MLTPKSGLFLAISCVAAIAAVGCVFELSSGIPQWGQAATTAILIGSLPVTVIAFLAAVKDARANF
ncbi:hypothetical protein [Alkalinema sp. FACHB-956]|uniref:hypothetical protein n=1 Tax=Alkalinema sp. FACHB-956 TaxID=2692768 RepID=UPI001686CD84|nr:hypothetical protein [Alkalinema sp. FACHB-956]